VKILFGAGNFIGSNIMLSRFLEKTKEHDIRIISYYRNHKYLHHIDWCLDAIYNSRNKQNNNYFKLKYDMISPGVNHYLADLIINEITEWEPDLVISDCELFTALVAKILKIQLWYCSPILQFIGINYECKKIYNNKIKNLSLLPKGDKYLVYSPLCDISSRPILKEGFEWVKPYYKLPEEFTTENIKIQDLQRLIPKNSLVTSGETSFVADCLYTGNPLFISPNPLEPEQVINAKLMEWYCSAINIGRSMNMNFIKNQIEKMKSKPVLSIQKWRTLDQKISEYFI